MKGMEIINKMKYENETVANLQKLYNHCEHNDETIAYKAIKCVIYRRSNLK